MTIKSSIRRIGLWGLAFFAIKGLVWLAFFAGLADVALG